MSETLAHAQSGLPDMTGENYLELLLRLNTVLQPKTYLEIGSESGESLCRSRCAAISVDPKYRFYNLPTILGVMDRPELHLFQTTSDLFFERHNPAAILGGPVELAFLDGMHLCEFLLRDFINTERCCRPSSIIMLHDCLPVEAAITNRNMKGQLSTDPGRAGWWAGDVWRTARLLKRRRPDLRISAFDAAPTGLLLVTNLNPRDTRLADDYDAHVAEMMSWTLEGDALAAYHAEMDVLSTSELATPEQITARYRFQDRAGG